MIARSAMLLALAATTAASQPGSITPALRLTQAEVMAVKASSAGAGTSGISGIRTRVLSGDPTASGLYTIVLQVPANTRIAAHTHRDDRLATVVSGTWYFGYGAKAGANPKTLGPGSFYTEPAGVSHFARTGARPVVLYIHGFGPTDTHYVDQAADPQRHPHRLKGTH
jgi:quercetin dioxygenase-like cupin family protein